MINLFEGLKSNDLQDLVLPLISIDEYESKLDDDSIVVSFFIQDKDPSQDLNRFIQKGAVDILDTDVSPAPNEDGNYIVFVEFERNAEFPQKLIDVLETLTGLTAILEWQAEIYDVEGVQPVTLDYLEANVRLVSTVNHSRNQVEEIKEFFRSSDLDNFIVEDRNIVMEARGVSWNLEFVDYGFIDDVMENNASLQQASRLDESALSNVRRMGRMLGDHWFAEQRGDYLIVGSDMSANLALFRL